MSTRDRQIIQEHPSPATQPFWVVIQPPDYSYEFPGLHPGQSAKGIFQSWHDGNAAYQDLGTKLFTVWDHWGLNCILQGDPALVQWNPTSQTFEVLGQQWNGLLRAFVDEASPAYHKVDASTAGDACPANGDTEFTTHTLQYYLGHGQPEALVEDGDEIWLTWNRQDEQWQTFKTPMDVGGRAVVGTSAISAASGATESSGTCTLVTRGGTSTTYTSVTMYNTAGAIAANGQIQYKFFGTKRYIDVANCG